ncbi:hypothetical protein T06_14137 [Trichinella sp. T6]|nr:hypothetical protein T06_14137 [Trichinella sp. T6]
MHMQAAVLKSKHCEAQPKSDLATVKHHSFHLFFLHRHFEVYKWDAILIIQALNRVQWSYSVVLFKLTKFVSRQFPKQLTLPFISSKSPSCSCAQLVMLIARTCGLRQYELPEVSLVANDLLIMIDLHLDEVNIFTLTYIEIHVHHARFLFLSILLTDNFCTNDSFSQMLMIIWLRYMKDDLLMSFISCIENVIMLFSPQSDFQLMFSRALWLRTLNLLQLGYAAGRFSQTKIRLCWLFRSRNFIKCHKASLTERASYNTGKTYKRTLQSKLCLQTIPLTFNARHWFVIVGYFLNFAFSRLTCTWMKGTIFIQKQEQPVTYYVKGSLRRYANVVKEKLNQHWDAIWTTGLKDETEKLEFSKQLWLFDRLGIFFRHSPTQFNANILQL